MKLGRLAILFLVSAFVSAAFAAGPVGVSDGILTAIRSKLEKKYPETRIEWTSGPAWILGAAPAPGAQILSVGVSEDDGKGGVPFTIEYRNGEEIAAAQGRISFQAMTPVRSAIRRILPGEKLMPEYFAIRDVNVASGQYRDYRGVILPPSTEVSALESRQTILEGQPLLSSAVQKRPDVRRGDSVRIRLISGNLSLSTLGTASEPGYLGNQVRVLSQKTKRELAGKLVAAGVVEVTL